MSETSSLPSRTTAEASSSPELCFHLKPDGRQVLTRKRARELLAPLSEGKYTSVTLGGCAFGDAAAGVAGPALLALAQKDCVRSVVFADCIASLPQDEALRSLSALASSMGICKTLRSVDLSYNALGSKGVAACAPLIHGQRLLEELYLVESGLAAESARLLQGYLCAAPTTNLRVLQIHANRLESAGMTTLSTVVEKSPLLERLRLSSLGARPAALSAVGSALLGKSALQELDLSDNMLDVHAAKDLAAALPTLTALERLLLQDLDMGDETLEELASALIDAAFPLFELALAGNELSPSSVPWLKRIVAKRLGALQILDVSRNILGVDFATALQSVLEEAGESSERPALTHLLVAQNGFPPAALVRLSSSLVPLPSLQCFDITGNGVSENVADLLATALGSNVVLYDSTDLAKEAEDAPIGETEVAEEDEELQSALEELANAPSAVPKDSPIRGINSGSAAALDTPSTQSKSAVSRLVSLFSRGTTEASESGSSRPSTRIEKIEDSGPVGSSGPRGLAGTGASFEDDSGAIPKIKDAESTPGGVRGKTITSSSGRDDGGATVEETPSTLKGTADAESPNVLEQARLLKESIASLSKDITDVTGELKIPVTSPGLGNAVYSRGASGNDDTETMNDYLLVGRLPEDNTKQSRFILLLDILGGLLVGLFVVILVLAIAQSQEESTFSYRLV